jgi:uncharacterized membrane protein YgcG
MTLKQKVSFFLGIFLFLQTSLAFAETIQEYDYQGRLIENWEIKTFNSDIYLNTDASADITETIVADFSKESHRGIERDIPYSFTSNRSTPIKLLEAIDEKGQSWKIKKFKENGYLKVQMTTPDDHLMNNETTFIVKYHIDNVFNTYEDHDEFYWNANGTEWTVPTNIVNTTIHSPIKIPEFPQVSCFTGPYGSTSRNCDFKILDEKTISISTTKSLNSYEGLTVVFGLTKGTITLPSIFQIAIWFAQDNLIVFLPIAIFLFMFFRWYKYGRDDQEVSNTIVPTFTPPKDLSPTETGTIIDERLDPKDITATIIDYAVRGYIKIKEIETPGLFSKNKDYELELVKPCLLEKKFEKEIILGIFNQNKIGQKKKISELENKFYTHVPHITDSVMEALIAADYFPHNPDTIRATYQFIGFGMVFASFFIANLESGIQIFSISLSGLIIAGFGAIMPRKTTKGTKTYYELKGLYEYINTAEKDRMKFQEQNNILFEKLLPYAMAFGLIDKWTKAFDGILKNPPSWYYPVGSRGHFNMIMFSNSLNNFSNSTTSNLTTKPGGQGGRGAWSGGSGFGGGGFSGGGFGGGGGRGL